MTCSALKKKLGRAREFIELSRPPSHPGSHDRHTIIQISVMIPSGSYIAFFPESLRPLPVDLGPRSFE